MSKREKIRAKRRRQRQRTILAAALVIAGIAVVVTGFVIYRSQSLIGSIVTPEFIDYPPAEGNALGDPQAPVVVEEFSDFQCPACAYYHENTLAQVIDEYVKTGKVYFKYRNFPIIDARAATKESHAAAHAALCAAEQGRFWQFHDMLFANQIGENVGSFSKGRLQGIAEVLGLDLTEFNACNTSGRYNEQIALDTQAAVDAGINSTPSFLVNGKLVVGALPIEQFRVEIENALEAAAENAQ